MTCQHMWIELRDAVIHHRFKPGKVYICQSCNCYKHVKWDLKEVIYEKGYNVWM